MEKSILLTILTNILSIVAGSGFWSWIKAREDKKKTPYDMVVEMLQEQKRFYEERNADYERAKLDSAEKSSVIMETRQCAYRFENPNVICPVDEANARRLAERCKRCNGYNSENIK